MEKIKLYVISGFLGSGKTTLLKKLIDENTDKKIAVIMNEFGKVGIDGTLLEGKNIELVEMNRGSIFCKCLFSDFKEQIVELSKGDFDYLFVESTGLADPSSIGKLLSEIKDEVSEKLVFSGNITVIDATSYLLNSSDEIINNQVESADLLIINKTDKVKESIVDKIEEKLKNINNEAQIITSTFFRGIIDILSTDLRNGKETKIKDSMDLSKNKPKSINIGYSSSIDMEKAKEFLKRMSRDSYRIKGFMKIGDKFYEVQVVGENIDMYETDRVFENSYLTVISKVGNQIINTVNNSWKELFEEKLKINNG